MVCITRDSRRRVNPAMVAAEGPLVRVLVSSVNCLLRPYVRSSRPSLSQYLFFHGGPGPQPQISEPLVV